MPRALLLDTPLMVKLDLRLKKRLRKAADEQGSDMSKVTRDALERYLDELDRRREWEDRGAQIIEHMTGLATSGMTTDEIMALTRGED